jgi:hypothetical protein
MAKSREHVITNGRASFYACMWDDLRNAAMDCGWALALHGSLKSDMDIMAMPWIEDAKPVEVMIQSLSDCFTECRFKKYHTVPHVGKPHGRIVYTMSIWADFYIDISIMPPHNNLIMKGQHELFLTEFIAWQKKWKENDHVDVFDYQRFVEIENKKFDFE